MLKRAQQDFNIRKQIIEKKNPVYTPRMDFEKLYFWIELAYNLSGYFPVFKFINEDLYEYDFNKNCCVAYSKGLESTLIHVMWKHLPTIDYFESGFEWTNPIEGAVAIYAASLGYSVCFYGDELDEDGFFITSYSVPYFYYETIPDFALLWKLYSGADFLSPFSLFRKSELFKISLREDVDFVSCFDGRKWCGKCFKCHITHMLYKYNNVKPPFNIKKRIEWSEQQIKEYKVFKKCFG